MLANGADVDEPVDRAQQVIRRDMVLEAEAVEQRLLHHRPLTHHQPSPAAGTTESDHQHDFNADFFNTIRPLPSLRDMKTLPQTRRWFRPRAIGRASCRERVCQYV